MQELIHKGKSEIGERTIILPTPSASLNPFVPHRRNITYIDKFQAWNAASTKKARSATE